VTDEDIRRAMTAIAAVSGLGFSAERIERAFPAYKSYLTAMDAIRRVELPLEAEPAPIVVPKPDGRS
jgi:hypothetical protein